MSAPLLTACKDDIDNTTDENSKIYTYSLVAEASKASEPSSGNTAATRALKEGDKHSVTSKWLEEDYIMAYVVNDGLQDDEYSQITNKYDGKGNRFNGDIKSSRGLDTRSEIAFLYPGKATTGNERAVTPVTKYSEKSSDYHETSNKTQVLVDLNLTKQDGTIETIGKRFDFQWTRQRPRKVEGKKIDVDLGKLKRIITIWGLRFTDNRNQPLTNIDSVYIANVKGSDIFDLSRGEFLSNNAYDERTNVVLKPANGKKLTSAGGAYTYAAFLPGTYKDVIVMAFSGRNIYMKSYPSLTFAADNIHRSDILQMEDVKQKPYVEVQGIKWATGNFIHYEEGGKEFWGIAPAQWWISRYAVKLGPNRRPNANGTLQSSQFEDGPVQTRNDVDLFRFGDIVTALNLKSDKYKAGIGVEISQKFFVGDGPLRRETNDRSSAQYGDIVWYHTMNNHKKYRYPREEELKTLYDQANVEPAYCYTDKGTVVYGAYYTTHNRSDGARKSEFPTGVRAYDKYRNVTVLVRANRGLFLPITGRRVLGSDIMGLRDMTWGQGAYGEYLHSKSLLSHNSNRFLFGPTKWEISKHNKAQASAIRPVLVSDDKKEDRVFAPFANIK